MREAVIVSSVRTAVGRAVKGTLRQTRPDDMAATAIQGALARVPVIKPEMVEDVILGCAMPEGEQGMNVGRNIVLLAGLPDTVTGMTVNRFCSSGLETINIGAMQIMTGQCDVVIAGGVESMSVVPIGGHRYLPNPTLLAEDEGALMTMGLTAERLAVLIHQLERRQLTDYRWRLRNVA